VSTTKVTISSVLMTLPRPEISTHALDVWTKPVIAVPGSSGPARRRAGLPSGLKVL
jgi:hypothetical protein